MSDLEPTEEPFSTQEFAESVEEEESDEQLTVEEYSPRITFSMPAIGRFLGRCCINLVLPFINGMMMGFGELVAHEIGFAWGMSGARVSKGRRRGARGESGRNTANLLTQVRRKRVAPGVREVEDPALKEDGQRRLLLQS